jgi:hypothetical protein
LIGDLENWRRLADDIAAVSGENKFLFESLDVHNGANRGGILFDTIRSARKATALILAFDGGESDFLPCVAGGIFTMADFYKIGNRHYPRKLILVSNPETLSVVPGLLGTKPGVHKLYRA